MLFLLQEEILSKGTTMKEFLVVQRRNPASELVVPITITTLDSFCKREEEQNRVHHSRLVGPTTS
jgi:hypothetical protein